jgi:hypothetical protein
MNRLTDVEVRRYIIIQILNDDELGKSITEMSDRLIQYDRYMVELAFAGSKGE